mgnify:CR=1 FL=1
MSITSQKCERCDGCGRIADSESGEPWTYWMELPLRSSVAVLCGIVKPISCPACGGSGSKESERERLDPFVRLTDRDSERESAEEQNQEPLMPNELVIRMCSSEDLHGRFRRSNERIGARDAGKRDSSA